MKKLIFKSASVFMMAVAAICFTACGSDDDSKNNPENGGSSSQTGNISESMLVGTWEGPVHIKVTSDSGKSYETDIPGGEDIERIEYKADHAVRYLEDDGTYDAATWTLSGNILTITYDAHDVQEYIILSLNANTLVLRTDEIDGSSEKGYTDATYRRAQ